MYFKGQQNRISKFQFFPFTQKIWVKQKRRDSFTKHIQKVDYPILQSLDSQKIKAYLLLTSVIVLYYFTFLVI